MLTRYLPSSPEWSPDGRHAVVESNGPLLTDPQGSAVNTDGERLLIIDPQGNIVPHESRLAAYISQWSPDGVHLAYSQRVRIGSDIDCAPNLGRLGADLSHVVGIVSYNSVGKAFLGGGWNKAGDRYYFIAIDTGNSDPDSKADEIIILDLHQPEPGIVTTLSHSRDIRRVAPSPDGDRLLIVEDDTVSVMDIDGTSEIQIFCPPLQYGGIDRFFASWAPDGEWIAGYNDNPKTEIQLWLARPDGSDVKGIWGCSARNGSLERLQPGEFRRYQSQPWWWI